VSCNVRFAFTTDRDQEMIPEALASRKLISLGIDIFILLAAACLTGLGWAKGEPNLVIVGALNLCTGLVLLLRWVRGRNKGAGHER